MELAKKFMAKRCVYTLPPFSFRCAREGQKRNQIRAALVNFSLNEIEYQLPGHSAVPIQVILLPKYSSILNLEFSSKRTRQIRVRTECRLFADLVKKNSRTERTRKSRKVIPTKNRSFWGRSHQCQLERVGHIDALAVGITSKKVNFIIDADIRSYLDVAS